MLEQIGQDKQRISERLMRLDSERTKLSDQLNELEIAERALSRFGAKGVTAEKRRSGRVARAATTAVAEPVTRSGQKARSASLGEATLKAVQAHPKGASADQVLKYLSRKFGRAVRPNHLGSALQRHCRAGRLENRDQRWYLPPLA
jgi:hypothetical protein